MAKNGGYEMVPAYTAEEVLGILEGVKKDVANDLTDLDLHKVAHAAESYLYEDRVNGPNVRGRAESKASFVSAIDAAIKKGQV